MKPDKTPCCNCGDPMLWVESKNSPGTSYWATDCEGCAISCREHADVRRHKYKNNLRLKRIFNLDNS